LAATGHQAGNLFVGAADKRLAAGNATAFEISVMHQKWEFALADRRRNNVVQSVVLLIGIGQVSNKQEAWLILRVSRRRGSQTEKRGQVQHGDQMQEGGMTGRCRRLHPGGTYFSSFQVHAVCEQDRMKHGEFGDVE